MTKRLLAVLLAVMLVASLGTVAALADDPVVMNDTTPYTDLQTAIDEANPGDTLELVDDINLSGQVNVSKGITIDLKGYNITRSTDGFALKIYGGTAEHPAEITDSTATNSASGIIEASAGIWIDRGITNITNITINATSKAIEFSMPNNVSTVTISGLKASVQNNSGNAVGINATPAFGGTVNIGNSQNVNTVFDINAKSSSLVTDQYHSADINISGGTYNVQPDSSYLADGYVATKAADGSWTVELGDFATVNDVGYNDLQEAIDAAAESGYPVVLTYDAASGETITLDKNVKITANGHTITLTGTPELKAADDVTIPEELDPGFKASAESADGYTAYYTNLSDAMSENESVKLLADIDLGSGFINPGKDLTLDMNGHDITKDDGEASEAIELSSFEEKHISVKIINSATAKSSITGNILVNASLGATYDLTIGKNVAVKNPVLLQGNGEAGSVKLDVFGEIISTGSDTAIQGNGEGNADGSSKYGGTVINIHDGAVVNGSNAAGIYHPQDGVLNVYKGATVQGATGIYMRSGTLNVYDGATIEGTGENQNHITGGGGYSSTGDALVVDNSNYPGGAPVVNIMGGDFVAEDPDADPIGSYNTGNVTPVTGFVSAGNYSKPLDESLLAPEIKYEVDNGDDADDAPYSYTSDIKEAVAAAGTNGSISTPNSGSAETTHDITIIDPATDFEVKVNAGNSITLPDDLERDGYMLSGWRDGSGKFYKPGEEAPVNGDTTFTAVWREIVIPDPHAITIVDPANGSIKTSLSNASKGAVITVTATPDQGYELAYITVDGEKITGNTFTMPDKAVTVSAVFVTTDFPFVDVKPGDWHYDYIAYVYENGLMNGVSATTFEPNANMTRAMVWTILARIDGETITGADWAADARAWAMANGVSDGTDPNGLVTREQFVTMLWRFAGEPTSTYSLAKFTDNASVSDWAETAMAWAVENGIITGVTDTTIVPQGTATRAQCAAMLMRFVENV